MGRYVRILALALSGVCAEACRHPVIAHPDPPHAEVWILPSRAEDGERFCVPDGFTQIHPCTTVGDVRRYIRAQRLAE